MKTALIIRAEPGAEQTRARASRLGLVARSTPLFVARPLPWDLPEIARFDAVMVTSAQAPRLAGAAQAGLLHLPCYAVGHSSARAATEAGYADVRVGEADGQALAADMKRSGHKQVLHLCGRDRGDYDDPEMAIVPIAVYAVEGADALPQETIDILRSEPVVLLHSPRSAVHFAHLCDTARIDRGRVALAAISAAAAGAAGTGWARAAVAPRPRDEALLELAAKLCKTATA